MKLIMKNLLIFFQILFLFLLKTISVNAVTEENLNSSLYIEDSNTNIYINSPYNFETLNEYLIPEENRDETVTIPYVEDSNSLNDDIEIENFNEDINKHDLETSNSSPLPETSTSTQNGGSAKENETVTINSDSKNTNSNNVASSNNNFGENFSSFNLTVSNIMILLLLITLFFYKFSSKIKLFIKYIVNYSKKF